MLENGGSPGAEATTHKRNRGRGAAIRTTARWRRDKSSREAANVVEGHAGAGDPPVGSAGQSGWLKLAGSPFRTRNDRWHTDTVSFPACESLEEIFSSENEPSIHFSDNGAVVYV
ncbi:hypothetical protein JYU34_002496 [Plutella xylostella]|uniref:Uncharacterized protein n=1 Tax=Plutella xylostella TaxID=51655 RepID=A0ABQ7R2C3_PLUXY|nr:hypothetical protein JYU34_002496 [Plutella xylostella]